MTETSISLQNVTKRLSNRTIIDNVTFSLSPGLQVALLGHNGAGKTTLFKLILGFLKPDNGKITVLDSKAGSEKVKRSMAFLPETPSFPGSLTGEEILKYYVCLKGQNKSTVNQTLERVGLLEYRRQRVGTYSKGMLQRLGLAQALVGKPRLVLLDEPTSGLDPIVRQGVYELIGEVVKQGATVLFSSHVLTEVEASTDRLLILSGGVLVANDSLGGLQEKSNLPDKLKITTKSGESSKVANIFGVQNSSGDSVEVYYDSNKKLELLAEIGKIRELIEDFEFESPSLSEIYRHYSGHLTGESGT